MDTAQAGKQEPTLAQKLGKPSLVDEPDVRVAHASLAELSRVPDRLRAVLPTGDLLRYATEILAPSVRELKKAELKRRGKA